MFRLISLFLSVSFFQFIFLHPSYSQSEITVMPGPSRSVSYNGEAVDVAAGIAHPGMTVQWIVSFSGDVTGFDTGDLEISYPSVFVRSDAVIISPHNGSASQYTVTATLPPYAFGPSRTATSTQPGSHNYATDFNVYLRVARSDHGISGVSGGTFTRSHRDAFFDNTVPRTTFSNSNSFRIWPAHNAPYSAHRLSADGMNTGSMVSRNVGLGDVLRWRVRFLYPTQNVDLGSVAAGDFAVQRRVGNSCATSSDSNNNFIALDGDDILVESVTAGMVYDIFARIPATPETGEPPYGFGNCFVLYFSDDNDITMHGASFGSSGTIVGSTGMRDTYSLSSLTPPTPVVSNFDPISIVEAPDHTGYDPLIVWRVNYPTPRSISSVTANSFTLGGTLATSTTIESIAPFSNLGSTSTSFNIVTRTTSDSAGTVSLSSGTQSLSYTFGSVFGAKTRSSAAPSLTSITFPHDADNNGVTIEEAVWILTFSRPIKVATLTAQDIHLIRTTYSNTHAINLLPNNAELVPLDSVISNGARSARRFLIRLFNTSGFRGHNYRLASGDTVSFEDAYSTNAGTSLTDGGVVAGDLIGNLGYLTPARSGSDSSSRNFDLLPAPASSVRITDDHIYADLAFSARVTSASIVPANFTISSSGVVFSNPTITMLPFSGSAHTTATVRWDHDQGSTFFSSSIEVIARSIVEQNSGSQSYALSNGTITFAADPRIIPPPHIDLITPTSVSHESNTIVWRVSFSDVVTSVDSTSFSLPVGTTITTVPMAVGNSPSRTWQFTTTSTTAGTITLTERATTTGARNLAGIFHVPQDSSSPATGSITLKRALTVSMVQEGAMMRVRVSYPSGTSLTGLNNTIFYYADANLNFGTPTLSGSITATGFEITFLHRGSQFGDPIVFGLSSSSRSSFTLTGIADDEFMRNINDFDAPRVSSMTATSDGTTPTATTATFTVQFSESVSNVTSSSFMIDDSATTATAVAIGTPIAIGSAPTRNWTVPITATSLGTVTLLERDADSGTAFDRVGYTHDAPSSNPISLTHTITSSDTSAPEVSSFMRLSSATNPATTASLSWVVTITDSTAISGIRTTSGTALSSSVSGFSVRRIVSGSPQSSEPTGTTYDIAIAGDVYTITANLPSIADAPDGEYVLMIPAGTLTDGTHTVASDIFAAQTYILNRTPISVVSFVRTSGPVNPTTSPALSWTMTLNDSTNVSGIRTTSGTTLTSTQAGFSVRRIVSSTPQSSEPLGTTYDISITGNVWTIVANLPNPSVALDGDYALVIPADTLSDGTTTISTDTVSSQSYTLNRLPIMVSSFVRTSGFTNPATSTTLSWTLTFDDATNVSGIRTTSGTTLTSTQAGFSLRRVAMGVRELSEPSGTTYDVSVSGDVWTIVANLSAPADTPDGEYLLIIPAGTLSDSTATIATDLVSTQSYILNRVPLTVSSFVRLPSFPNPTNVSIIPWRLTVSDATNVSGIRTISGSSLTSTQVGFSLRRVVSSVPHSSEPVGTTYDIAVSGNVWTVNVNLPAIGAAPDGEYVLVIPADTLSDGTTTISDDTVSTESYTVNRDPVSASSFIRTSGSSRVSTDASLSWALTLTDTMSLSGIRTTSGMGLTSSESGFSVRRRLSGSVSDSEISGTTYDVSVSGSVWTITAHLPSSTTTAPDGEYALIIPSGTLSDITTTINHHIISTEFYVLNRVAISVSSFTASSTTPITSSVVSWRLVLNDASSVSGIGSSSATSLTSSQSGFSLRRVVSGVRQSSEPTGTTYDISISGTQWTVSANLPSTSIAPDGEYVLLIPANTLSDGTTTIAEEIVATQTITLNRAPISAVSFLRTSGSSASTTSSTLSWSVEFDDITGISGIRTTSGTTLTSIDAGFSVRHRSSGSSGSLSSSDPIGTLYDVSVSGNVWTVSATLPPANIATDSPDGEYVLIIPGGILSDGTNTNPSDIVSTQSYIVNRVPIMVESFVRASASPTSSRRLTWTMTLNDATGVMGIPTTSMTGLSLFGTGFSLSYTYSNGNSGEPIGTTYDVVVSGNVWTITAILPMNMTEAPDGEYSMLIPANVLSDGTTTIDIAIVSPDTYIVDRTVLSVDYFTTPLNATNPTTESLLTWTLTLSDTVGVMGIRTTAGVGLTSIESGFSLRRVIRGFRSSSELPGTTYDISISGNVWTIGVHLPSSTSIAPDGEYSLIIPANVLTDGVTTFPNDIVSTESYVVNRVPLSVDSFTRVSGSMNPTNVSLLSWTLTLSDSASLMGIRTTSGVGLTSSESGFSVRRMVSGSMQPSEPIGTTYDIDISGNVWTIGVRLHPSTTAAVDGDYVLMIPGGVLTDGVLTIADDIIATESYTLNRVAPFVVSVSRLGSGESIDRTNGQVSWRVIFDDSVSGFTTGDVRVEDIDTGDIFASPTSVIVEPDSPTTYTVNATLSFPDGALSDIPLGLVISDSSHGISDSLGNLFVGAAGSGLLGTSSYGDLYRYTSLALVRLVSVSDIPFPPLYGISTNFSGSQVLSLEPRTFGGDGRVDTTPAGNVGTIIWTVNYSGSVPSPRDEDYDVVCTPLFPPADCGLLRLGTSSVSSTSHEVSVYGIGSFVGTLRLVGRGIYNDGSLLSVSPTIYIDNESPDIVSLDQISVDMNIWEVNFSESVENLNLSNIVVNGGPVSSTLLPLSGIVRVSDTQWTLDFTDTFSGTLALVPSAVGVRDLAGNILLGINGAQFVEQATQVISSLMQSTAQTYITSTPRLTSRLVRASSPSSSSGSSSASVPTSGTTGSTTSGTSERQSFSATITNTNTDIHYSAAFPVPTLSPSYIPSSFVGDSFELWFQGTYSSSRNDEIGLRNRSYFLHAGIDRQFWQSTVLGVLLQVDSSDDLFPSLGAGMGTGMGTGMGAMGETQVEGRGWLAGPYITMNIGDSDLLFEARLGYGESQNEVNFSSVPVIMYETVRLLGSVSFSGLDIFDIYGWRVSPNFEYAYYSEESSTSTFMVQGSSAMVPGTEFDLNRFTFGPSISRSFVRSDGSMLTPVLSFSGIMNDLRGTSMDDFTGKVDMGINFMGSSGFHWNIGGYYEGLGSDIQTYGITGGIRVLF